LDKIFRPLEAGDNLHHQEPISVKKLLKGDAHWATTKTILGRDVNTKSMTITLPKHRLARLDDLLDMFPPTCTRISVKEWQKFLGELRSMLLAIPGVRGQLSLDCQQPTGLAYQNC
jgi:hypothetical protein